MIDTSRNITPHFTIDEVAHSDRAIKEGWDNTMPDIYFGNAQNLAKYVLEPIRLTFGQPFSPLSWYRSKKLNEAVGGSPNSDHMIAAAADIALPKVSLLTLAEYIRDNLDFDQLILEERRLNGWVHVSYRKDDNRKEVLTNINGKYIRGLA